MISPKYASTHYYHGINVFQKAFPHVVNLYLDYNCPFSGKIYAKILKLVPELEKSHPGQFQFVFVNVVQPWHVNSVYLNEYALVVAQLLRGRENANTLFWNVSKTIFEHKSKFYDTVTADLGRTEIYHAINDVVFAENKLPFSKEELLRGLVLDLSEEAKSHNLTNAAGNDIKYFTKYLRGVGVHVTPTVSVDGVVDNTISSGSEISELVSKFEAHL